MTDIKALNDNFRQTFTGGRVMLTAGINVKSQDDIAKILSEVRQFNHFTKANDPYGEHETSLSFAREERPQQRLVVRASRKR
ncbi:MAG: DUF3768 domain-containing protein [Alphaproteobacteria bacterium]|nr:DUF3768 domain-containing protein [Alphaproteobacteria bacterium]MBP3516241.1 DUF3768 domain-containing protein [Alphaproteobacteria bacterium]